MEESRIDDPKKAEHSAHGEEKDREESAIKAEKEERERELRSNVSEVITEISNLVRTEGIGGKVALKNNSEIAEFAYDLAQKYDLDVLKATKGRYNNNHPDFDPTVSDSIKQAIEIAESKRSESSE